MRKLILDAMEQRENKNRVYVGTGWEGKERFKYSFG